MQAYELLAYLQHLTLSGYEDGEYEWIGKTEDWQAVSNDVSLYEMHGLGDLMF